MTQCFDPAASASAGVAPDIVRGYVCCSFRGFSVGGLGGYGPDLSRVLHRNHGLPPSLCRSSGAPAADSSTGCSSDRKKYTLVRCLCALICYGLPRRLALVSCLSYLLVQTVLWRACSNAAKPPAVHPGARAVETFAVDSTVRAPLFTSFVYLLDCCLSGTHGTLLLVP